MRIANLMQSTAWGSPTPDKLGTGVGGREGAMLNLSREWAKLGCDVTCFVDLQGEAVQEHREGSGTHSYVDFQYAVPCLRTERYDMVVSWEWARIFADGEVMERQTNRVLEMQVAHFTSGDEQFVPFADHVACLSPWAGRFLGTQVPGIEDKVRVMPNCVDSARYAPELVPSAERKLDDMRRHGPKFFYSSSPDRGLVHALRMWPRIRETFPGAVLHVAYGVDRWVDATIWAHYAQADTALEMRELMGQDWVIDHGTMGQDDLAQLQRQCTAFLYPCDTMQQTETGCITAIEALASGCPAFITDCDCLGEEFDGPASVAPLPLDYDLYLSNLETCLNDDALYAAMHSAGLSFASDRRWELVAPKWLELVP
jgi:glycosyltransferase involved in cell wall biosynthesis